MSDQINNESNAIESNNLREENPFPKQENKLPFTAKSVIPTPVAPKKEEVKEPMFTAAQVKAMALEIEKKLRKEIQDSEVKPGTTQVVSKEKAPIKDIDWTKLSVDDIYDMTIPMQAKPFGSVDALKVELVDGNYEARWVNTNPMRLGKFLAWGFTYVEPQDLKTNLATEVVKDANGHYVIQDVVLMKIPKPTYYAALRAAHERAVNTVSSVKANQAAAKVATDYLSKETGGEFNEVASQGKVAFYNPGIEI